MTFYPDPDPDESEYEIQPRERASLRTLLSDPADPNRPRIFLTGTVPATVGNRHDSLEKRKKLYQEQLAQYRLAVQEAAEAEGIPMVWVVVNTWKGETRLNMPLSSSDPTASELRRPF